MNRQMIGLYSMLTTGEYLTAEVLAQTMQVSSKTVRNQLKNLNEVLVEYDAFIESKHGTGYRLVAKNQKKLRILEDKLWNRELQQTAVPNSAAERVKYLLEFLLRTDDYIKLDDLSEFLYISKKTLTGNLKTVENLLSRYHLCLHRKPNYGIRVEGREFDRRLCIAENDLQRMMSIAQYGGELRTTQEREWIRGCIQSSLSKYSFMLSNVAYQDLILHIQISIARMQSGHFVESFPVDMKGLRDNPSYHIAKEILQKIQEKYALDIPDMEIEYLAIHLEGKKTVIGAAQEENEISMMDDEIRNLADYMLRAVDDAFRFDFRSDPELKQELMRHLEPLVVRLQHDMKLSNPLLKEIKERYSLSYTMATTACVILNYRYHTIVGEDEIGYIALLFTLALERKKNRLEKKNVLLVCGSGRASAQLLLYWYKTEFGQYIKKIDVCDVSCVADYDMTDIDCVFTTVPITEKLPVPVQEVEYILKSSDAWIIKRALMGRFESAILDIYREELFLPHMKFRNKDEALRVLCDYVYEHGYASSSLIDSVRAREAVAKTTFGNLVAMPHPIEVIEDMPFVCVALLDEPLQWEDDLPDGMVQAIFLVSVANSRHYDAQKFYQITARLFLDESSIKELIRNQNYETLKMLVSREEQLVEEDGK